MSTLLVQNPIDYVVCVIYVNIQWQIQDFSCWRLPKGRMLTLFLVARKGSIGLKPVVVREFPDFFITKK